MFQGIKTILQYLLNENWLGLRMSSEFILSGL
jgi:hypothetical protein